MVTLIHVTIINSTRDQPPPRNTKFFQLSLTLKSVLVALLHKHIVAR